MFLNVLIYIRVAAHLSKTVLYYYILLFNSNKKNGVSTKCFQICLVKS